MKEKARVERVSSPEQLSDYIRVSDPVVWTALGLVIAVLLGVCVWGVFGHLDTVVRGVAVSDGVETVCYIPAAQAQKVAAGNSVTVEDGELTVASVSAVEAELEDYVRTLGGLSADEAVCAATLEGALPQGTYAAKIIVEQVAPIYFVMN